MQVYFGAAFTAPKKSAVPNALKEFDPDEYEKNLKKILDRNLLPKLRYKPFIQVLNPLHRLFKDAGDRFYRTYGHEAYGRASKQALLLPLMKEIIRLNDQSLRDRLIGAMLFHRVLGHLKIDRKNYYCESEMTYNPVLEAGVFSLDLVSPGFKHIILKAPADSSDLKPFREIFNNAGDQADCRPFQPVLDLTSYFLPSRRWRKETELLEKFEKRLSSIRERDQDLFRVIPTRKLLMEQLGLGGNGNAQ